MERIWVHVFIGCLFSVRAYYHPEYKVIKFHMGIYIHVNYTGITNITYVLPLIGKILLINDFHGLPTSMEKFNTKFIHALISQFTVYKKS